MMFQVDDSFRLDAEDASAGLTARRMPSMRVSSITFGGYASEETCRAKLAQLAACVSSEPPAVWYVAVYNGPFRFWNRKNKVFYRM
jgi:hypothetical protein